MDGAEAGTNGRRAEFGRHPPSRKRRGKGGATPLGGADRKGWASLPHVRFASEHPTQSLRYNFARSGGSRVPLCGAVPSLR